MPPFGGVEVCNAFGWRETDSRKLPGLIAAGTDIIGPGNNEAILQAALGASIVVCGWGNPGNLLGRGAFLAKLLDAAAVKLWALKVNQDGTPQHPLYISYRQIPVPL